MLKKNPFTRKSTRSPVTPSEVQGTVHDAHGRACDLVLVWNVSDEGLCLWATDRFKAGDTVSVAITKPEVLDLSCEVRWCRSIPDQSGYLLGLETDANLDQLRALHTKVRRDTRMG